MHVLSRFPLNLESLLETHFDVILEPCLLPDLLGEVPRVGRQWTFRGSTSGLSVSVTSGRRLCIYVRQTLPYIFISENLRYLLRLCLDPDF